MKKVQHLGTNQKPERTGTNVDGESVELDDPLPQPESHVVANDGEWNETNEDGQQARPTDQLPQPGEPELVLTNRSGNEQGGGEADIDGRKASPIRSRPHSDIEVGAGSGPCRDGNGADGEEDTQVHSHSSPLSTPHGGKHNGALTCIFKLPPSSFTQTTWTLPLCR